MIGDTSYVYDHGAGGRRTAWESHWGYHPRSDVRERGAYRRPRAKSSNLQGKHARASSEPLAQALILVNLVTISGTMLAVRAALVADDYIVVGGSSPVRAGLVGHVHQLLRAPLMASRWETVGGK
jgi:hypothetical protein